MLYKNVDICDLESILKNGILPLDYIGTNWEEGRRASNRTDMVYLFSPKKEHNSFTEYGAVLLEINTSNAIENEMVENDIHKDDYTEYVVEKVEPYQIVAIYIPELFKIRVSEYIKDKKVFEKITWVKISADYYNENQLIPATYDILKKFAETSEIESTQYFNFFRGEIEVQGKFGKKKEILDLYNLRYLIN